MHLHPSRLFVVLAIMLCSFQAWAQDAQEAAIKKAIIERDEAFLKKNAEAWKSSWIQDSKISSINTGFFGSKVKVGWDSVTRGPLKYLMENPTPDSVKIERDSFMVRREGNMAIVDYKQHFTFPGSLPPFDKAVSREQRVLLKKNGKWLVAAETSTDITGIGPDGIELSLNGSGYNYLFAGKTEEAIKVFELNAALFPGSYNVWDSLGEAYLKAGNKEKAKECYEKSLAINPNSDTGKKALAELK